MLADLDKEYDRCVELYQDYIAWVEQRAHTFCGPGSKGADGLWTHENARFGRSINIKSKFGRSMSVSTSG